MHEESDAYSCEFTDCNKTFQSPKSLKKHIRIWHNPAGKSTSVYVRPSKRVQKINSI